MKSFQVFLIFLLFGARDAHGIPAGASSLAISRTEPRTSGLVNIFERQNGQTCSKCRRKQCRRQNKYRDQSSCKCKKCPPGTRPDTTKTACIPDDKRQKKEKRYEDTKKDKEEKRKDKKDKKEERYNKIRKEKRDAQQKKNGKNRMKQRMGKCLAIVPLAFVGAQAAEFTNEYFSEEFVSDADDFMMQFWTEDLPPVPDTDEDIENDDYIGAFIEVLKDTKTLIDVAEALGANPFVVGLINGILPGGNGRREAPMETSYSSPDLSDEPSMRQDLSLVHEYDKRALPAIALAVTTFVARVGPVIARVGAGVARFADVIARGGVRLAKGAGRQPKQNQQNAANRISKTDHWKRCIRGQKP